MFECQNASFTAVLCSVLSFGKLLKLGLGRYVNFPPLKNVISLQSVAVSVLEGTHLKSEVWCVKPEILEFVASQMGEM